MSPDDARANTVQIEHPAKFSKPVLKSIVSLIEPEFLLRPTNVLDPFAGVGTLFTFLECAYVGCPDWSLVGLELEPEWAAQHPAIEVADALEIPYPANFFDLVITSPSFGNRMADHHNAKDGSKRTTYKHVLGRPLSENNSGAMQWGPAYREFHERTWSEVLRVIRPGGTFILNIKNHVRKGVEEPVAQWHVGALTMLGFGLSAIRMVKSEGNRYGKNGGVRVDYEYVFRFKLAELTGLVEAG